MHTTIWYLIVASSWLLVLNVDEILGHGMLVAPVNRGSMWRAGYQTPINYDDMGNFCGGYAKQWEANNGQCGVCGDDYSLKQPRPNENTGTYGTGITVDTYEEGSLLNLTVLITANHKGYFQFSICRLAAGNPNEIETEDCFNEHPLRLADGSDSYALTSPEVGLFSITVKLPDSLTCDRCVLRWHWTTGNNWGVCTENGQEQYGALGCGPQETFRTCSDISIV